MGPELRDFRHGLPEWDLSYEIPATGRRSCSNRRQKAHDDKSVVVATDGRVFAATVEAFRRDSGRVSA